MTAGSGDQIGWMGPAELKSRFDQSEPLVLLDVREPDERALVAIAATPSVIDLHIPMAEIPASLSQIAKAAADKPLVVYCHLGQRSAVIAHWLLRHGVGPVFNLEGGIDAWAAQVDTGLPRY